MIYSLTEYSRNPRCRTLCPFHIREFISLLFVSVFAFAPLPLNKSTKQKCLIDVASFLDKIRSLTHPCSNDFVYSLSYVYSPTDKDPRAVVTAPTEEDTPIEDDTPNVDGVPIVDDAPIEDDLPGPTVPLPVPSPGDTTTATESSMNRFTCNAGGEIALEENTSPDADDVSVDIEYSYSFESSVNDPNTVILIEAAIVGTMVSTLLDCSAPSSADGRVLAPASAVSTTFSNVTSTGK